MVTPSVHGFVDYSDGAVFIVRPGKPQTPVTVARIRAVNREVWEAFKQVADAFGALWNTTKGNFEIPPVK